VVDFLRTDTIRMAAYPLEIIIPVYNEGKNINSVFYQFQYQVQTKFRVIICYDHDDDNTLTAYDSKNFDFEILQLKNSGIGAHDAVITGLYFSNADCVIVFPGDDLINQNIIDKMYARYSQGCDIVVASRFMKGGSMKGCPLVKSVLVRAASKTLHYFSSIPVKDASNGFRLFSRQLLDTVEIESKVGFSYSIELLVKCDRLGWKIGEVPAQWEERVQGKSRFRVAQWVPNYIRWYFYGLSTSWLFRGPKTVSTRSAETDN
jgi:dolichol-phosphate mannosyltransferase